MAEFGVPVSYPDHAKAACNCAIEMQEKLKTMRAHWDRVLSAYLLERRALRGLVIVVDIRRGVSDLDQALINMIGDGLPLHILLTKADKLSRSAVRKAVLETEKRLRPPQYSVSALSILDRQGLELLERRCRDWLEPEEALVEN